MLIVVGLLLVTGLWDQWVAELRSLGRRLRGRRYDASRPTPSDRGRWVGVAAAHAAVGAAGPEPRRARPAGPGGSSPRCAPRWCCCSCWRSRRSPGPSCRSATSTRSRSPTGRTPTRRLTPVYEKLGLFDVYGSVWFSAIYLLLMVSLVGCIVPRLRIYWRAFRAAPPRVAAAPRPAAGVAHLRARRGRRTRSSSGPAPSLRRKPLPGRRRPTTRDAVGRARLPARGRQPALPRLGARGAGRLRLRPAVRLQGRRGHRRRAGLLQLAEPVRRLRARLRCSTPTTSRRSASTSTTST